MKSFRERIFLDAALSLLLAALLLSCREKNRFEYDFEHPATLDDVQWKCGTLLRLVPDHATSGTGSLEVTVYPGPPGVDESYPGFSFVEFDRDWYGYRTLSFDAFLPGEKAIRLSLRIDDRHNPDYGDRFNASIPLTPGSNHIAIPLASLSASGSKRPLNVKNILGVRFFLANPQERQRVFFDRVRLE